MLCLKRKASLALVAAVLLAALVGGFVGDFVHTDDGCAFETHCLACQRAARVAGRRRRGPHGSRRRSSPSDASATSPTVAVVPAAIRAEASPGSSSG